LLVLCYKCSVTDRSRFQLPTAAAALAEVGIGSPFLSRAVTLDDWVPPAGAP
jgi:hypothetical protein